MSSRLRHAVTGAFGYSGRYISGRLLDSGCEVVALTNSVSRVNPFGKSVTVAPFNFDHPERLTESLKGVRVLYNTYWVRYNHADFSHAEAVKNTKVMFDAAKRAGVERIVHFSVTNASADSPLEYFKGKGELEIALKGCGISYAILRPAIFFGGADILINNIAWAIRKLPIIGVFGEGQYRLQPIYIEDMAELAIQAGNSVENFTKDAIGPETFTYRGLIETIGREIGVKTRIINVGPNVGYSLLWLLGKMVGDTILTRAEIAGLTADLLCTDSGPVSQTRLTNWLRENRDRVGRHYANEIKRRVDRISAYDGRTT